MKLLSLLIPLALLASCSDPSSSSQAPSQVHGKVTFGIGGDGAHVPKGRSGM
ncbi:hypothetical protein KBB96_18050 [Luteolibacter ambystomatis]|uniref:Lipoprotein n=1 Tax=Luteolibacter ambystomatis TaxID=2824561 RepID=A0A975G8K0_9BACT|nr:hypothetical protein [Luteolibacter ambystomatis]QUE50751.1 hypothetical protein KBB96_18050 [Luteolibacter ambystomatis]